MSESKTTPTEATATPVKAVKKAPPVKKVSVTPAVDAGGLIPAAAATKMQQTAGSVPPAAPVAPAPAVAPNEKPMKPSILEPGGGFNRVYAGVMVTLNLVAESTWRDFSKDIRSHLSSLEALDGTVHDVYNAFRRAPKRKAGDTSQRAADGALRGMLPELLELAESVNRREVLFLGRPSEARSLLADATETLHSRAVALLPFPQDHLLVQGTGDDEFADDMDEEEESEAEAAKEAAVTGTPVDSLYFRDAVRVSSWIAAPTESQGDAATIHNAMINLTVNSPSIYDSVERLKSVTRVETVLGLMMKAKSDFSTNIILAVAMSSSQLAEAEHRTLIDQLQVDADYHLFTKDQLLGLDCTDWLPQTAVDVTTSMLPAGCDLLFIKLLADPSAAADVPAEAAAE